MLVLINILVVNKAYSYIAIISGIALVSKWLLNAALIPLFHIEGIAAATAMMYGIILLLHCGIYLLNIKRIK